MRPRIANESERSSLTNHKESTQEASKSQGDGKLRPWRTIALELEPVSYMPEQDLDAA